jgi:hypothetical protein
MDGRQCAATAAAFLALSCGFGSTAAAAPPWSTPVALDQAAPPGGAPVFARSGAGMVVLEGASVAPVAADGTVGTPLLRGQVMKVAVYGKDRFAAVLMGEKPTVAFGTTAGFTRRVTPSKRGYVSFTDIAGNRRGDVAIAIGEETDGKIRTTVWVQRAGSDRFRRVLRLPEDKASSVVAGVPAALALEADGDLLVSYQVGRTLWVQAARRSGKLGTAQALGPMRTWTRPEVLFSSEGRVTLAWASVSRTEGTYGPGRYRLVTGMRGKAFGRPQVLGGTDTSTDSIDVTGVRLVVRGTGALVAWTASEDRRFVVRAAPVTSGRAGTSMLVTPAGAPGRLQDLDATKGGAVMALWSVPDARGALRASVMAPRVDTFAAPEKISAVDETVFGAGASVNPVTLAPIVIYENGQHQGRVSVRLSLMARQFFGDGRPGH